MDTIWLAPALLCYTLAAAAFIVEVTTGKSGKNVLALVFLGAGAGFHSLDLVTRGLRAGAIPVMNFPQSLSVLAWLTALASIVLIARLRTGLIGAVVAPSVLIALAGASLMIQGNSALPSTLRSAWLPVHVTLAVLGEALFVMAASLSLVYLVYCSRLKAKRPFGTVRTMPSLERLDRLNYRLLGWGFALLSLASLSGALWAEATAGHF